MKHFYLLLALLSSTFQLVGQTTVQIGTGNLSPSNTLYSPLYRFSGTSATTGGRSNIIFTAAELSAAGITSGDIITSLAFNKTTPHNFNTGIPYTLRMGNTTNTPPLTGTMDVNWSDILATQSVVFTSTNYNVPATTGWVTINLATPFSYTGGSLEISTEHGASPGSGNIAWEYTAGFDTYIIGEGIGSNNNLAAYKQRPNIQITFINPTPCTQAVAGTPTPSSTNLCLGNSVSVTATGASVGLGTTFQWQESADNSTWTNLVNDTNFVLTTTPSSSVYYRVIVGCGTDTDTSSSIFIDVQSTPMSGTYTINSAFPTDITTQNFQNFADAVDLLNCVGVSGPVVFNVIQGSGPYDEQIALNSINGASDVNTITFNGNGETLTTTSSSTSNRHLILLDGAKHITINEFVLQMDTTQTENFFAVLLTNEADSNVVSNNEINMSNNTTASTVGGVAASGSTTLWSSTGNNANYLKVFGNTFNGGYFGVRVNGQSANYSQEPMIYDNIFDEYYYYGIYLSYCERAVADNNTFNPKSSGTTTNFHRPFYFNYVQDGFQITNNKTSSVGQYWAYLTNSSGTATNRALIANNVLANSSIYTGTAGGVIRFFTNSEYIDVFHNSFALGGDLKGLYSTSSPSNIRVKNNVFYSPNGNLIYDINTSNFAEEVDYNNYYSTGTDLFDVGGVYSSLQTFEGQLTTTTPNDANSIYGDPIFVDLIDMIPGSILIKNQGTPLAEVTEDILGVARNTTAPDMGAYEYTPFAIDAEATDFTSPLSECGLSNAETVSVLITNFGTDPITNPTVGFSFQGDPYITEVALLTVLGGQSAVYTFNATANMAAPGNYTFQFFVDATGDANPNNDTSVVFTRTSFDILAAPITEDFETFIPGTNATGYQNGFSAVPTNTTTEYRWIVNTGATSTAGTGPANDNTLGTVAGKYIYTQSTSGNQGDEAMAMLPCLDLSSMTYPGLEFYYHMYGDEIDRLFIDVLDNGIWIAVDSIVGEQQTSSTDAWERKLVNVSNYANQTIKMRFRGVRGAGVRGNMAIDDVATIELPSTDGAVVSATVPDEACSLSASEEVSITVRNEGGATLNTYDVSYSINGGSPVVETVTTPLPPATNYTHTFATNADLSVFQVYNFEFSVNVSGDTIPDNDVLSDVVTENLFTPSTPQVITTQQVCKDDEGTLWANSDSSFVRHVWFRDVIGQNPDFIGDTIITGPLSDTTVYYVQASTESLDSIPAFTPNSTTTSMSTTYGLMFDVNIPSSIKEVDVFSMGSAGTLTILLRDVNTQAVLATYTPSVSAGSGTSPVKHTIELNTPVLPVGQYAISLTAYGTGVQLVRDLSSYNDGYPVSSSNGEVTIPGYHTSFPTLNTSQTNRYYFYNLKIGSAGCSSPEATIQVNVPRVKLGPDTTLCDYDNPYVLDAGPNFDTYLWNTGATTQSIEVTWESLSAGYFVQAVSGNCTARDTVFVIIDCPVSDGLTTDETQLKIYPNPSQGLFNLEFIGENREEVVLEIIDQAGRVVYKEVIPNTYNYRNQLELNNVSQGVYFIRLFNDGYSNVEKLVIR